MSQSNLEGNWILKSGVGAELLPNTKITAEFKDGRLSGNAGCNQYFTGYMVEPIDSTCGKIEIGQIGSTLIFCREEINGQERSYFQALGQVSEYNLTDEGLVFPYPSPWRYLSFTRQFDPIILDTNTPVESWPSDSLDVEKVTIDNDNLSIEINYSGGCAQHEFRLIAC